MDNGPKIQFACGSMGHPDYCPGECQFGRYCKFIKGQSIKPRGTGDSTKVVIKQDKPAAPVQKREEPKGPIELKPYYR